MAINFSAQFIVNEKTSTRVLRLTDTSTGFTLSKGNFIVTFPDGSVVSNTDFSSPQISTPGGNTSISLITDTDNTVLTGTYVINYVAVNTSLNEFTKTETFDFNWEKPAKAIINDSDVVLPEVQFKDLTAYETSGSFTGVLTRNFFTTTPSTSEVGVITKTSVGDILTPSHLTKYYEGIYLVSSDVSVLYTHTSKSWLTVAYTDLLQETFDVREAPTQDELVALMNTYKDQIEAYKTTNPAQYEILNEQYDLVLALYSHILARYQTNTLDGSKAILDQLLGLLPPASSYTYKATQMLPFTINFSTSLTGTGTTGTLPKFTGTTTLGDSIIKEDTNRIGIGKTPTTTLDVNGTIKGTSIVKSGGTSSEFLKADGSVDANTYLTTGSAASSYQPLDGDLSAIAVLAGAAGILTKTSANTWTLDTTSYQTLDADLTAIAALAGTSGFLIKTAANTWTLDTTSYQTLDADLTAIAALAGTSGLIRKTAANTYELDTSVYLTGINSGQVTTALGFTPENAANKGVNNGYASLDGGGKVPSSQLPSYVKDVIEVSSYGTLPATGETGKIYITLDTNKIYRWSGSVYVEVSSSAAVWGGITGTLSNQTDLQTALDAKLSTSTAASTYVPYTGATTNVDLGEYNIKSGAFKFDLTPSGTLAEGTMQWNSSDGTVDIGLKGGNVVLQVGQETVYEVRNETGTQIPNGTAVYANGVTAGSSRITAAPYVADGSVRENRFLGLATENISNGVNGFVTHFGYVRGLDTRGTSSSSISVGDETWAVGDVLYVHPTVAGKLTNVKPQHEITVAIIITRHQSSGILFVRPSSGGHLEDIHDVSITSVANNQGLFYEASTDLWKNKSIATVLGYTPANILNPVFTDNVYISGTNPRLYFTDTDSNPDYTIFIDEGNFYILNQTSGAYKLLIQETGNISAGVGNSMIATSFIRRGGTSEQFLMADGSVTTGSVFNYPGIGIAVSGGGGWLTSIDDNSVNWNAAYSARISSLVTSRSSGSATFVSNVLDIPTYTIAGLGGQPAFTSGTGFVKISGTTISYVNETYYLASNPSGYITSAALAPYLPLAGGTLTGALGGTSATFSGDVTANSFVKSGGTSSQFLKADGSVDIRSFVTTGALDNYLPLTGGSLTNSLSSGYVLSVSNVTEAAGANGLYVNIASGSTGTPFRVDRGGVSLISVNYLGATLLKSTITANAFIKASGTSSEYLMADGSVSTGLSFTYPDAGIVVSTGTAWGTSITDNSSNWNTAYSSRITSATAPLNITGTTISISQAGASANGFLSSTDWNTFNNKASTASLGNYLPLSGGTLTGALNGTTASFSSSTNIIGVINTTNTNGTTTNYQQSGTNIGWIGNGSNALIGGSTNDFTINGVNSLNLAVGGFGRLTIASTGAATFSSSVTATGVTYISGNSNTGPIPYLQLTDNYGSAGRNWAIMNGYEAYGTFSIKVSSSIGGNPTTGTPVFNITQAGNVGIGTTSPGSKLTVAGSATNGVPFVNFETTSANGTFNWVSTAFASNLASGNNLIHFIGQSGSVKNSAYLGFKYSSSGSNDNILTLGLYGVDNVLNITGAGNVGIGTNLPGSLLTLYATTTPTIAFQNAGAVRGYISADSGNNIYNAVTGNGHVFQSDSTERMRITSGGNVYIGGVTTGTYSTSGYMLGIRASYGGQTFMSITAPGEALDSQGLAIGVDSTAASFYMRDSKFMNFFTANSERMRITSGGNVGIGATSPGATRLYVVAATSSPGLRIEADPGQNALSIGGTGNISVDYPGIGGGRFLLNSDGALTIRSTMTASSFFESSDKTIKTLIEDNYQTKGIESVTAKLYLKNGVEELGYFAQDLQGILPSAVSKGADGLLSLSYREVHTAKIARLEKRVAELEKQLNLD
jgi:hypothetical protein